MAITTANLLYSTVAGALKVITDKEDRFYGSSIIDKIYKKTNSEKAVEKIITRRGISSTFQPKQQLAPFALDNGYGDAYARQVQALTVGKALIISGEAIEDDLYIDNIKQAAKDLKIALMNTKNIYGALPFNSAFDQSSTVGDNKALCATDHPLENGQGTMSNTFAQLADLNYATLQSAVTQIMTWKSLSGSYIEYSPKYLMVHPKNALLAEVLLASPYTPVSANHAINPLHNKKMFSGGVIVNPFLSNPDAWFILTDTENDDHHSLHIERQEMKFSVTPEASTNTSKLVCFERYNFAVVSPYSVFGARGSV